MSDPLRIALMGCGHIAPRHAHAIQQLSTATLVGVCDLLPYQAEAFGKQYNAPYFTNSERMIKTLHPDVLSILTPSGDHAWHTILYAGRVPHIVVEKPLALIPDDITEMASICNKYGTTLTVVKQNRYNPPIVELCKAIDQGRLGNITLAAVRVRWRRDQLYYMDWHGTWQHAGGVLANQAIHHVDLLRWLCGSVSTVYAYARTALVQAEVEDTLVAVLKFTSGALGTIEATTATRPTSFEGSLSILGEGGTIEVGGFAVNKMLRWEFEEKQEGDSEIASLYENPPDVYGFGHQAFYADYINAIQCHQPPPISWQDGYNAVELVHAIYESVETGREIVVGSLTPHVRLGKDGHNY